jgi:hypothetical protein
MVKVPKSLAEKGYFQKTLKDKNLYKYMYKFYRTFLKPGRAKPFSIKRMTLYTCQYVFPPTRGYPQGRPCVDDVYNLPDPDCPACNGTGHPQLSDKYREVRVMGLLASMGTDAEKTYLFGTVDAEARKLVCGLPISPEYTSLYGLKPKTDVLDKNGNVVEKDVFIGYKLELNDIIVWDETYFDGMVERVKTTEYLVTGFSLENIEIGYFRTLQVAILTKKNVDSKTTPQPRF